MGFLSSDNSHLATTANNKHQQCHGIHIVQELTNIALTGSTQHIHHAVRYTTQNMKTAELTAV